MKRVAFLVLLLVATGAAAEDGQRVRLCDRATATNCATINASGQVSIVGSISASTTGRATAAAPSYSEGTDNPLSIDLSGNIRTLATAQTAAKATAAAPSYVEGSTSPLSQDLSGNLRVGVASLPLPTGASTETTLAAIKAKTDNLDVLLSTRTKPADTQKVDGSAVTQPVSGTFWQATQPVSGPLTDTQLRASAVPVSAAQSGTWTVQPGNTANTTAWKVDGSAVTQPVSGTVTANQGTANATPWNENVAQYGGSAVTLGQKVAASSMPTVPASDWVTVDATFKALRTTARPPEVLGCYSVSGRSGTYGGLAANTPLWSMRWGDATRVAIVMKVGVAVLTTVTATTVGITERQLIIARAFTASDTGGTAVTLTGNNQKRRTSQGTSLVTDMRFGNPITAGTRTLDAAPVHVALGWTTLLTTGFTIGSNGGFSDIVATGTVRFIAGGAGMASLLDATNGQDYPITLVQNEGIVVRIGTAEPAGATQETFITIVWCEATAY